MSTLLSYRGYTAKVDYDAEAEILHGTVLDLRDAIEFQAKELKDVKRNFHRAVDEYLDHMERTQQEPEKPFKGNIAFRTSSTTHKKISLAAAQADMSINSWMDQVLSEAASAELKGYRYDRASSPHTLLAAQSDRFSPADASAPLIEYLKHEATAIAPKLAIDFSPYASRKDPGAELEITKAIDKVLEAVKIDPSRIQEAITKLQSLAKPDDQDEVYAFVGRLVSEVLPQAIKHPSAAAEVTSFSLSTKSLPVVGT